MCVRHTYVADNVVHTVPRTSFSTELQFIGHIVADSQGPCSFSHAWSAPKATIRVPVRTSGVPSGNRALS